MNFSLKGFIKILKIIYFIFIRSLIIKKINLDKILFKRFLDKDFINIIVSCFFLIYFLCLDFVNSIPIVFFFSKIFIFF